MSGIDRITRCFKASANIKIMAHAVCGYPDMASSGRILETMASSGADLIEAQLPFSDPSADGPSIVAANHGALRAGSSTAACLAALAGLRGKTEAPILVMSYLNPLLAYGIERLLALARDTGIDGFIIPDYPDDEDELDLAQKCEAAGLALVPLVAPSTSLERAGGLAASRASPFLYVVLRLGVTGRKTILDQASLERLAALRKTSGKYVAAGFGLRERGQVAALQGFADCAIVGSALVDAAREAFTAGGEPAEAVGRILRSLR